MELQAHHLALCGVPSLREPRLPAQCLGSGHMSQGSSKMGKSRRLYNSSAWRSRGSWKFLAILTVSMPQTLTSPDCRLWSQEAPLERVGTKAGVLEAPLATQGLKQGLRPFLPAGNGASGSALLSSAASGPPPHQQLPLEGSRCVPQSIHYLAPHLPENWVGRARCLPSPQQDLTWLLITHGLYYFSFVL